MNVTLLYALEKNTDNLVYIKDVENGLKCNCYCPDCKKPLIAKNGGNENLKDYHFSHDGHSSCSSYETYLHFLSKIVLSEMQEFFLPEGTFDEIQDYLGNNIGDNNKYFGDSYKIVKCYIEKKIQEEGQFIRPDIILELDINGKTIPFLIEVAVNHFIEENKFKYIQKNNFNCIEIDLNNLKEDKELWNKELLKKELLNKERLNWINQTVYENKTKINIEIHQQEIIDKIKNITEYFKNKTIYFSGLDGFYFYLFEERNLNCLISDINEINKKFNEEKFNYLYFELLPYNRYEIEKNETFNNFLINGIKIKQNNKEKKFLIKNVEIISLNEYDYCFEFTTENEEKIVISTTDKIKRIENKYKKLKLEYYLYHETRLSLEKLRELLNECYIPQKIIKN